jgi:hypothetical protein
MVIFRKPDRNIQRSNKQRDCLPEETNQYTQFSAEATKYWK